MDKGKILESWKEIAAYLNRNVRTCQLWEREMGLPFHRLDGSPKARVFGYKDELDRWLDEKLHEREATPKLALKKLLTPGLAFLLLVAVGVILWHLIITRGPSPFPAASGQPVLAVLHFENTSGDMSLDIWSDALSVLLITELSQSKYIRVVSGEYMLTVLRKLGLEEARRYSSEDIRRIAARTRASHVLGGSFIKAGESIVITADLQKPGTGGRPSVLRVEARGENEIIPKVGELTRQIKEGLNLSVAQITGDLGKEAGKAATSSPEALKYYIEGLRRQYRNEWEQAVAYMEKAVALDPEFAMAYKALATAHRDLGHVAEARKTMKRALELSARLPAGEPLFIEGQLAYWDQDYAKMIKIFKELLKTYPGHLTAHRYLGYAYNGSGDIDKAIEHQEFVVLNRKTAVDVRVLAGYYQKRGLYQKAEDICQAFLLDVEDLWNVRQMLIYALSFRRQFDRAVAEAEKNYLENPHTKDDLGAVLIFQDDLAGAEKILGQEALLLNRGKFEENIDACRRNLERSKGRTEDEAAAFRELARALDKAGRHEEAYQAYDRYLKLSAASRDTAGEAGLPYLPDRQKLDLFAKGRIQGRMQSFDDARMTLEEMRSVIAKGINKRELRYCENILGLIELGRGNTRQAADFFNAACSRLDFEDYWHTEHALFYDDLARALYESGKLDKARKTYERITLLTTGRIMDGDLYAKAFYMLGKIAEKGADRKGAREHYRRFLNLWKDADPGTLEVEEAKKRLAAIG
jgi:tetratricopeptide (TPR) repeat protein